MSFGIVQQQRDPRADLDITSASMPLGRWSTMNSVTLYLRSSRAIVPKMVCAGDGRVEELVCLLDGDHQRASAPCLPCRTTASFFST